MKIDQASKLLCAIAANSMGARKLLMRARRARVEDPPASECAAPLDDLCDVLHALANLYDLAERLGEEIYCGAQPAEAPEAKPEEGADGQ